MSRFGERLHQARRRRGLKQAQLGAMIGVSGTVLSNWERGIRQPNVEAVTKLVKALDVSPDYFTADEQPGVDPQPSQPQRPSLKLPEGVITGTDLQDMRELDDLIRNIFAMPEPQRDQMLRMLNQFVEAQGVSQRNRASREERFEDSVQDALPFFKLVEGPSPSGITHPEFLNVAAGEGADVERTEKECHVEEFARRKDMCVARIKGDSMSPIVFPNDLVVLQTFDTGFILPRKEERHVSLSEFKRVVPDNTVVVMSINDESITLKRIHYSGTDERWYLQVVADNTNWGRLNGYPRVVSGRDRVAFYAKLVGRIR